MRVTLPGSPRLPRSCLDRGTRSATTTPEMEMLRRRVWQQQGVVSLHLEDITDPWLRQAIQNEAVRRTVHKCNPKPHSTPHIKASKASANEEWSISALCRL